MVDAAKYWSDPVTKGCIKLLQIYILVCLSGVCIKTNGARTRYCAHRIKQLTSPCPQRRPRDHRLCLRPYILIPLNIISTAGISSLIKNVHHWFTEEWGKWGVYWFTLTFTDCHHIDSLYHSLVSTQLALKYAHKNAPASPREPFQPRSNHNWSEPFLKKNNHKDHKDIVIIIQRKLLIITIITPSSASSASHTWWSFPCHHHLAEYTVPAVDRNLELDLTIKGRPWPWLGNKSLS